MPERKHRSSPPKSARSHPSLFRQARNTSFDRIVKPSNTKPLLRRLRSGESKAAETVDCREPLHIPPQCRATKNYIRAFTRAWTTAASTPHQTVLKSDLTFDALTLLAKPRSRLPTSDELKQSCNEIPRSNTVWTDLNDVKLMQYLPNFIPENLAMGLELELDRLVLAIPPKISTNLARYDGFQHWCDRNLPSEHTPCGELRLLIHNQVGHGNDRPGPSADLAGQSYRTEAALEFKRSEAMTVLTERLSRALGAIDKDAWKLARAQVMAAKKEWASFASADIARDSCFTGLFVLTNTFTLNHLDSNDLIDGWAAMVVLGHFEHAPLYVPQLKAKLPHQHRDTVFLRSRILQHFSDEFRILSGVGRYVLVFTNHQSVFNYLSKHYQLVY